MTNDELMTKSENMTWPSAITLIRHSTFVLCHSLLIRHFSSYYPEIAGDNIGNPGDIAGQRLATIRIRSQGDHEQICFD
jgi:hypothetical protein